MGGLRVSTYDDIEKIALNDELCIIMHNKFRHFDRVHFPKIYAALEMAYELGREAGVEEYLKYVHGIDINEEE